MGKPRVGVVAAWIGFAGVILAALITVFAGARHQQSMKVKDSPGSKNTQVTGNYLGQEMNKSPYGTQVAGDQNNYYSTPPDIARYAEPAFWRETRNCGDRIRCEDLIFKADREIEPKLRQEILKYIEDIKLDYKSSTIGPVITSQTAVCKQGTFCDPEPIKGFSAKNVIEHLDIKKYPECTSRARAAYLLSNIETAGDKDEIDMNKVLETLVIIMQEDSSLLVSKLALDRYSQFTNFEPSNIFDFKGATEDWNKRRLK